MSAPLTAEQARQVDAAAAESYERIKWLVIGSRELLRELRSLARESFVAGLRQGEQCKGDK
jgi:hypothetical protein